MSIYYDASEKGVQRRGKEWRQEAERLMAGSRAFASWRQDNTLIFGALALGGFLAGLGIYGVGLGILLGGILWSYGLSRYTDHCRKIILAAEWAKLEAKEKAPSKPRPKTGAADLPGP